MAVDHNAPAVRMTDVEFRRRKRVILTDVNLTIQPGENWVLFGPNGIGKSTLISMMATRGFPSEGTVEILGNRLGRVDVFSYRNRIGVTSTELAEAFPLGEDPLDAVVTALNAVTGRWHDTYTDAEYDRARSLMERFGISYLEGKQMYRLSNGERTRVMICRALMADSDLIILDEPTTGLDLGGRELVIRALRDIASEDSTRAMVLVTHRLEEIPEGFDHLAIVGRMSGSEVEAANVMVQAGDPAPGTIVYTGSLEGGFTDENMTQLFGMPLHVVHEGTRWGAFAV